MPEDFGKAFAGKMKDVNPDNVPMMVGIGWYRPETYEKCLAIFDDRASLPRTYREWLGRAEATEKSVKTQGMNVVRVDIDPETFPAWCAANGFKKIDKDARMAFGNMKAAESGDGVRN